MLSGFQSREVELGYTTHLSYHEPGSDELQSFLSEIKAGDVALWIGAYGREGFENASDTQLRPKGVYCIFYMTEPYSALSQGKVDEQWTYTHWQ